MASLHVKHNMEIAHRLSLPGKCQNIHGHSMHVKLYLEGALDRNGILEGIDFGTIKKDFRKFIDDTYDHHLALNKDDEWARKLTPLDMRPSAGGGTYISLPGLVKCDGDPTVENLCKWIYEAMRSHPTFGALVYAVEIEETGTNGAMYNIADELGAHDASQ